MVNSLWHLHFSTCRSNVRLEHILRHSVDFIYWLEALGSQRAQSYGQLLVNAWHRSDVQAYDIPWLHVCLVLLYKPDRFVAECHTSYQWNAQFNAVGIGSLPSHLSCVGSVCCRTRLLQCEHLWKHWQEVQRFIHSSYPYLLQLDDVDEGWFSQFQLPLPVLFKLDQYDHVLHALSHHDPRVLPSA